MYLHPNVIRQFIMVHLKMNSCLSPDQDEREKITEVYFGDKTSSHMAGLALFTIKGSFQTPVWKCCN